MNNNFIAIIIPCIALIISGISIYYAHQANQISSKAAELSVEANNISKEALEQVKKEFMVESRPWLNIELAKFQDTDSYFKISRKNNIIETEVRLRLTNTGKTPATNISSRKRNVFITNIPISESFKIDLAPTFALGPGQEHYTTIVIGMFIEDKDIDKEMQEIKEGHYKLDIKGIVSYASVLDNTKIYGTYINYEVTNINAIFKGREMK